MGGVGAAGNDVAAALMYAVGATSTAASVGGRRSVCLPPLAGAAVGVGVGSPLPLDPEDVIAVEPVRRLPPRPALSRVGLPFPLLF